MNPRRFIPPFSILTLRVVEIVVCVAVLSMMVPDATVARQTSTVRLLGERDLVRTPDHVQRLWTVDDGLPVNAVRDVVQTHDGLIWLATIEGLVRFDGGSFTAFTTSTSPALRQNRLSHLEVMQDDWMLIHGENHEIALRDPDGNILPPSDHLQYASRPLPNLFGNGILHARTPPAKRYRYRGEGVFSWVREPPGSSQFDLTGGMIAQDSVWTWMTDRQRGLFKWNSDSSWTRVMYPGQSEDAGIIRTVRGVAQTAWFLHTDLSVSRLDADRLVKVIDSPKNLPTDFSPSECFLRHPDGAFIVGRGGRDQGLYRLDRNGLQRLHTTQAGTCSLVQDARGGSWLMSERDLYYQGEPVASGRFNKLLKGIRGDIWIASDEGLHRFALSPVTVIHKLANDNTYGVFEDRDNRIWISNWDNDTGNILIDGRLWDVSLNEPAIMQAIDGRIWAAYPGPGGRAVQSFDPAQVASGSDTAELYGIGAFTENARVLFEDASGRHWIGFENSLHERTGRLFGKVGTMGARAIVEEPDGVVWFGGQQGLSRFGNGEWQSISDSSLSIRIRGMLVDPDVSGRLWIASEDAGLRRVDISSTGDIQRSVPLSRQEGLFQDGLHHVVQDDFGRLWFNTNFGVFWVDKAHLNDVADGTRSRVTSVVYNQYNGLLNREGNGGFQTSALKSSDGRIWFASQEGMVVIDPSAVAVRQHFPARIVGLAHRDKHFIIDSGAAATLPKGERDFEIIYTAAQFTSPDAIAFEYRLIGYDEEWQVTESRSVSFTNIPPGDYTFETRVATADQQGAIDQLALTIPAFWYESWWFFGALILMLTGAGISVPAYRLRAAERARKELDRLVSERTQQLRERTAALREAKQKTEQQANELRGLNEAKSRIFANLSHEFRTPLTLILGPLQEFLDRSDNPDRETHEMMRRNAEELLSMVNQVLALARLENHTLPYTPRTADLSLLITDVVNYMRPHAERKRLKLSLNAPDELMATFDPDLMERVASNLISNAIKFTPEDGTIEVSVGREDSHVVLSVKDSGIGIAPEYVDKVFDRFFQVDASSTRRHEGAGIGLALVKELIQMHHGTVSVSTTPGKGSFFLVRIPALPTPGASAWSENGDGAATKEPSSPPQPELYPNAVQASTKEREGNSRPDDEAAHTEEDDRTTILLVDDQKDIRQFIRSILGDSFSVVEASDGAQAWELTQQCLPDLILSDVMMPTMDGFEFNQRLKSNEETASIPVVFLTALAEERYKLQGIMSDVDLYVTKPFEPELLLEQVHSILRRRDRLRKKLEARLPAMSTSDGERDTGMGSFEKRVRAIILEHLTDDDLDAQQLASHVGLSYSQLHRRLKKEADKTPTEMIRSVRLETALPMLRLGDGTISEVAFAVGFNSLSYFNRCFQSEYGMTPSAYIKKEQKAP